jgi:hypothetical protein
LIREVCVMGGQEFLNQALRSRLSACTAEVGEGLDEKGGPYRYISVC